MTQYTLIELSGVKSKGEFPTLLYCKLLTRCADSFLDPMTIGNSTQRVNSTDAVIAQATYDRSVEGRKGKWRLFLKTANRHGKNKRAVPSLTCDELMPLAHAIFEISYYITR